MIWFLYDDFDLIVCEITIWNNLKRLEWNKKKFFKRVAKRNVAFRVEWALKFIRWTIKQLIFIDEFVVNERTNDRKINWSFVETSFYVIQEFKRNKKWNILSTYTIDDYIFHLVHHDNIIVVIFNDFIRYNVFSQCFIDEVDFRNVFIMNNVKIHRNDELRAMCVEINVQFEYLFSYFFDYNFIEISFVILKIWIKKTYIWRKHTRKSSKTSINFWTIRCKKCNECKRSTKMRKKILIICFVLQTLFIRSMQIITVKFKS